MSSYRSGDRTIAIEQSEPSSPGAHPALLILHGAGGSVSFWFSRLAPALAQLGVAAFAPHYFEKTGTGRATPEIILDGHHVPAWLAAINDALTYISARPSVDARRIGVLGISLGGYLAIALAAQRSSRHQSSSDTSAPSAPRLRAAIELSGGMPPDWAPKVSAAMPPTLILHGAEDTVVPVSEAIKLDQLLTAHNVPHQLEIFPGETHWFSSAAQLRLLLTCGVFLRKHL